MDLYDEKEHVISSDEYTDDDDDDDALMNDAVRAQDHNAIFGSYNDSNKQPKWRIDQQQKQLSSLIRRNKISVIYKNKSIKWLNNKRQRQRYKDHIYLNAKNRGKCHHKSTIKHEEYENRTKNVIDKTYDIVKSEEANNEFIFNKSKNKEIIEGLADIKKFPPVAATSNSSSALMNSKPEKNKVADKESTIHEQNYIKEVEKFRTSVEKEQTRKIYEQNANRSNGRFNEKNQDIDCGFSQRVPADIKKFWEDLTLTLNGSGPPLKDSSGWKKIWTDYKSGVKKKLTKNKQLLTGTGGGPYKEIPLTDTEEETEDVGEKRERSSSPRMLNESTEMDTKHNDKRFRAVSPQFYKSINDMFPKFDKIATDHIDAISNTLEDKMQNLSNEIDTLNEIIKAKEIEWNRLSYLKMIKEEIYSRLNKKKHILQLKESFSSKHDQNILLELKELEFYLSENKTIPEAKHSSISIKKLIENRADMNAEDLKREKNNTSRLHSLLVSQNMLHAAESLENDCTLSNGDKTDLEYTSKNSDFYCQLEGGRLANSRGRQGEVRDVKSLIADFRQKNPDLLPRVGKRIKSTELNLQRQGYSIPLFEKAARAQFLTKDHQTELYSLPSSVDEISITPIVRSKKLATTHNIDFSHGMNNQYNLRLEDTFLKNQVKAEFNGKSPKNIQYPLCQECKMKESRFVCAGCGNQWYCSKKCQISAWDKHSELCME